LTPLLIDNGIQRLLPNQLNTMQKRMVHQIFDQEIFSVLTPMAVPPDGAFPLLPNQMLAVCVKFPPRVDPEAPEETGPRFAIIPFPRTLPRFFAVPSEKGLSYMHLEDIVTMSANAFFPGEEVQECVAFRLTRNAE